MNTEELDKLLEVMGNRDKVSEKPRAVHDDVLNQYSPKVTDNSLPESYRVVWDASIIAGRKSAGKGLAIDRAVACVPKPLGAKMPFICFGQLRIAPNFRGWVTFNQKGITGSKRNKLSVARLRWSQARFELDQRERWPVQTAVPATAAH
jgi:hypothetical protein